MLITAVLREALCIRVPSVVPGSPLCKLVGDVDCPFLSKRQYHQVDLEEGSQYLRL